MIEGIIISGCSGVGKSTLIKKLLEKHPDFVFSVSYTTRPPRKGEVDGVDYVFVSRQEFERMKKENLFLEWEEVYGAYYGTPKAILNTPGEDRRTVIFELDTKGALNLKAKFHAFTTIAVIPPDLSTMRQRLAGRGTLSSQNARDRLKAIGEELQRLRRFDFCVVNDNLETAVKNLELVISAQRFKRENFDFLFDKLLEEYEVNMK